MKLVFRTISAVAVIGFILLIQNSEAREREARIVGGNPSTTDILHYLVYIQIKIPGNNYYCGGVIYNKNYVVTAAHCIIDDGAQASQLKLGFALGTKSNAQWIDAESVTAHSGYSKKDGNAHNDIAVIKLKWSLTLGSGKSPIGFAPAGRLPPVGYMGRISGWGQTGPNAPGSTVPMQADVGIADCKKAYPFKTMDTQICAGGYPDTCPGDSGGPLVCLNDLKDPYVCGITSISTWLGGKCGNPKKPGIYTRISSFRQWLSANAGSPLVSDPVQKIG